MTLKVLDLFSGIGGFSLGLERTGGFETIGFCEIEPYCQKVLKKHWPDVPIYDDVRTLEKIDADVITAGFPCQPASVAGKRRGTADDRWLWEEIIRLVRQGRPRWIILENVPGLLTLDNGLVFESVLSDLEEEDYEVRTVVIPACAVDAKHRRDRLWIVANASSGRFREPGKGKDQQSRRTETISSSAMAHTQRHSERPGLCQSEPGRKRGRRPGDSSSENVADPSRDEQGRQEQRPQRERTGQSGESITAADALCLNDDDCRYGSGSLCRGRSKETEIQRSEINTDSGCGSSEGPRPEISRWQTPARWEPEPSVGELVNGVSGRLVRFGGRTATGIPGRVNKLKALGNSVVPQIPEIIGYAILEAEKNGN